MSPEARGVLEAAQGVLLNPDCWIQGFVYDKTHSKFCAVGAASTAVKDLDSEICDEEIFQILDKVAIRILGVDISDRIHLRPAAYLNDTLGYDAVLRMYAIALGEA